MLQYIILNVGDIFVALKPPRNICGSDPRMDPKREVVEVKDRNKKKGTSNLKIISVALFSTDL